MLYSRFKLNLRLLGGDKQILYDTHYVRYSLLLSLIRFSDPKLAEEIHTGKRKRAFLHSNIIFPKGKFMKSSLAHFYVSSPYSDVMKAISSATSTIKSVKLGTLQADVLNSEMQILDVCSKEFSLLSPIVIRNKNGSFVEVDDSADISAYLKRSLERVWEKIFNEPIPQFSLSFEGSIKKKLFKIKNTTIRAYTPVDINHRVVLSGPDKVALVALYFGVGDKTHFGFGMLGPKMRGRVNDN